MKITNPLVFLLLFLSFGFNAQNMETYTGGWEGSFPHKKVGNFTVLIEGLETENATLSIANDHQIIREKIAIKDGVIALEIPNSISFKGILSNTKNQISGFITSGILQYHVTLSKENDNTYKGFWSLFMVDEFATTTLYLSVEEGQGDNYQAYPIFADNRFTGTWCGNFKKEEDLLYFYDYKTGLHFKGKLRSNAIELTLLIADKPITTVLFKRSNGDWKIGGFNSKSTTKNTNTLSLTQLETAIAQDSLTHTHAVLVSKKGKLIYENYFKGYNANIPHDMRSASKSVSSAITGIAWDKKLLRSLDTAIFNFLPATYQTTDTLKRSIDFKSLLTMSSGLDADDYRRDGSSAASEGNYQSSPDWLATVLKASMVYAPNTHANYGTANPYLLGVALDTIVDEPMEFFIDSNLFQKLGITNYIIQNDEKGRPYFGGGMYLTPRDMLSFGELYLNNGTWQNQQILSKDWVVQSLKNYRPLENTPETNGYGYLWWHHTYQYKGTTIASLEARGAGGQYIFVLPALEVVVVVTSGNYRNGKTQQPELLLERYVLPYLD